MIVRTSREEMHECSCVHNCPPTLKYLSHPGLNKRANNSSPVAAKKQQITSRQGDAESRAGLGGGSGRKGRSRKVVTRWRYRDKKKCNRHETREAERNEKRKRLLGLFIFSRQPRSAGAFSTRWPTKLSGKQGEITSVKITDTDHYWLGPVTNLHLHHEQRSDKGAAAAYNDGEANFPIPLIRITRHHVRGEKVGGT